MHAYNELYLNKTRNSMAVMLNFAVHDLHQDADAFFELFITSGMADLFGSGDVKVTAGMSGIELAYRVLEISGIAVDKVSYRYTSGRSREYWAGWALAFYQWETAIPFEDIFQAMPASRIITACSEYREHEIEEITSALDWMDELKIPDHMNESDYISFRDRLNASINCSGRETRLKTIRLRSGLSQGRLAALSGVPVRTIQQYEQRRKDINKAAFESIIKLAAALSCEPSQLIECRQQ